MRKLIAGLIAGLVLGSTGVAGAAVANSYWSKGGSSYSCQGISSGVICKERYGLYQVAITKGYVGVTRGKKVVAACARGYGAAYASCESDW